MPEFAVREQVCDVQREQVAESCSAQPKKLEYGRRGWLREAHRNQRGVGQAALKLA
jgi:hypothetical protein